MFNLRFGFQLCQLLFQNQTFPVHVISLFNFLFNPCHKVLSFKINYYRIEKLKFLDNLFYVNLLWEETNSQHGTEIFDYKLRNSFILSSNSESELITTMKDNWSVLDVCFFILLGVIAQVHAKVCW